ncbi:MAG: hypothetical protein KF778_04225 [Rhodocyclaceae bacterium]|nr:hypothetical protein [Rhodocyclaceae bacterium]MBX3667588.1 hypothetical protein [Rhodocyclaceae bacterium]
MLYAPHRTACCVALALCCASAHAIDWSDTSISFRYGTKFAEPFEPNDIHKRIYNLTYANGYKYGTNYLNVDLLLSDGKDPRDLNSSRGAQEVYVVYRHTLDIGKVMGKDIKFGPVRGVGATLGFDVNTKDDRHYNSEKRMLVAGPTLMFDVPGFLNASLLARWESNAPLDKSAPPRIARYRYDTHPMLSLAWGVPIGSLPLSFEGYANFIAAKGKDEFGNGTKPETHIDMQIMYDLSSAVGASKNTFKVGLEYEYWRNKFGVDHTGPAGSGAFAKTPMVRAEYHF